MKMIDKTRGGPLAQSRTADRPSPEAYTIPNAISVCGIGRTKLYEELNSGRLKSFRLCGRRLIMREDLLAWIRAARDTAE